MNSVHFLVAALTGWLVLSVLQWRIMSSRHRRHMARMQDRYRRAQQHTEQMLSNCRRQVSELQKTLRLCQEGAQARSAVKQATSTSTARAAAREIDLLFRDKEYRRDPYVDAVLHFAETRPMPDPNPYRPPASATSTSTRVPEHGFAPTISFGDAVTMPPRKIDVWAHERLV